MQLPTRNNVLLVGVGGTDWGALLRRLYPESTVQAAPPDIQPIGGVGSAVLRTKYYRATVHFYWHFCNEEPTADQVALRELPFHAIVLFVDGSHQGSLAAVRGFLRRSEPFPKADVCLCLGANLAATQVPLSEFEDECLNHGFEFCALPANDNSLASPAPSNEEGATGYARPREALESTMWPHFTKVEAPPPAVGNVAPEALAVPSAKDEEDVEMAPSSSNLVLVVGTAESNSEAIIGALTGTAELDPLVGDDFAWSQETLDWRLTTTTKEVRFTFHLLDADELGPKQRNRLRNSRVLQRFQAVILVHIPGSEESLDTLSDFVASFPVSGPAPWAPALRVMVEANTRSRGRATAAAAEWCHRSGFIFSSTATDTLDGGVGPLRAAFEAAAWPVTIDLPAPPAVESPSVADYESLPDHSDPGDLVVPQGLWLPMFRASHPNRVMVIGNHGSGKRWIIQALQAAGTPDPATRRTRPAMVPYGFMKEVFSASVKTKYYTTTVDFYPVDLDWISAEEAVLLGSSEVLGVCHALLLVVDTAVPGAVVGLRDWVTACGGAPGPEVRLVVANGRSAASEGLPPDARAWFRERHFECVGVPHAASLPAEPPANPPPLATGSPLEGLSRLVQALQYTQWPVVQLVPELIATRSSATPNDASLPSSKPHQTKGSDGGLFPGMRSGFLLGASSGRPPPPVPAVSPTTLPGPPNPEADSLLTALRPDTNRLLLLLGDAVTAVESVLAVAFGQERTSDDWHDPRLAFLRGREKCRLVTHRYVATIDCYWAALKDVPSATVLQPILSAFDAMVLTCDAASFPALAALAETLPFLGDCKLLLPSDDIPRGRVSEWADANGWDIVGCVASAAPSLADALRGTHWRFVTPVAGPVSPPPDAGSIAPEDPRDDASEGDGDGLGDFDDLLAQVMQMRMNAAGMPDDARRERAAHLASRMLRLAGDD